MRLCLHVVVIFLSLLEGVFGASNQAQEPQNTNHSSDLPTKLSILGPFATDPETTQLIKTAQSNYKFIGQLGKDRSEKSRMALLRIAFGEIGKQYARYAAKQYTAMLSDKCQAQALLVADDAMICSDGLLAIRGCPIEPQLAVLLQRTLASDASRVRSLSAKVLANAPLGMPVDRVADLIVASMKTTMQAADAGKTIGYQNERYNETWPAGELSLAEQAEALGKMKNVPPELLQRLTPNEPGLVRDFILVARAFAKDGTVKGELQRILKDSSSARVRLSTLQAYAVLGNKGDIPFLQTIEQTDPFRVESSLPNNQSFFPIRSRTATLIEILKKKG